MSIKHGIWKIENSSGKPEPKKLSTTQLDKEKILEELILKDISILDENWLLIGQQVHTNSNKFIDLLAIDGDGSLIIIEQAVVAHAKGGVVLRGNGVIGPVFFNGPHVALRAQARRFQAHGAGGRANVPHHAVGAQLHARQAQGARFQLGDQALFGLALRVSRVGQAKAHGLRRRAAAPEDDDVQRREIHARRLLRGQLGMHALARLQEVFGHGHQKVIAQPFGQQHAGDARGRVAGAGEHQKPLVRAHGLRQRVKAVAGGAAALRDRKSVV